MRTVPYVRAVEFQLPSMTERSSAQPLDSAAAISPEDLRGEELFLGLVDQLRSSARALLGRNQAQHTLQPTALVHEAFLRLFNGKQRGWRNEQHVVATAGLAMRQVLIDHARAKNTARRSAPGVREPLEAVVVEDSHQALDLLELEEALVELEEADPLMARVVEMRYFVGLELAEIAPHVGTSVRTLQRKWHVTRAWLHARLS